MTAANGGAWLLRAFASLSPGSTGVVDIDFARHGANAWVVHRDELGGWGEARVELERDRDGTWSAGACSSSTWDGWVEVAEPRPLRRWEHWGPVLGVVFEAGGGSAPNRTFSSVRGVAAADVAAVEFGLGRTVRRRAVDSPTGGFLVTVPVFDRDRSPRLRVVYVDGTVVNLNP